MVDGWPFWCFLNPPWATSTLMPPGLPLNAGSKEAEGAALRCLHVPAPPGCSNSSPAAWCPEAVGIFQVSNVEMWCLVNNLKENRPGNQNQEADLALKKAEREKQEALQEVQNLRKPKISWDETNMSCWCQICWLCVLDEQIWKTYVTLESITSFRWHIQRHRPGREPQSGAGVRWKIHPLER